MSDIVFRQQSTVGALQVVKTGELLRLPEANIEVEAPIYLASDVHLSDYGIRGFVLVDTKPENRVWGYHEDRFYNSGETMSGREKPDYVEGEPRDEDPVQIARYYGTRHGFKAVRFFVLPEAVREFFGSDKFLGEPMIAKCLEEGTTPSDFGERPILPRDIVLSDSRSSAEDSATIRKKKVIALASILPLVDPTCPSESTDPRCLPTRRSRRASHPRSGTTGDPASLIGSRCPDRRRSSVATDDATGS